ncbi:hypothetical protein GCM10012275_18930 [Longimycelium tulufanense]|uniref:Septum formation-related domain-containing protein n=2 Tax=Longimycelium tulufanense TaxID=907463 RepID=A0A8J3CD08_9PSEU|nr:hypothetical protein GCM10012275_18930 [Longimycelium tulufanense]
MGSRGEALLGNGRTASTRLVMLGGFAGAILAITISTVLSWDVIGSGGAAQRARAAEASARAEAFSAPAGACLNWTRDDKSDIRQVPCTEKHLFELIGNVDVAGVFGKDAPFPKTDQWLQLQQERCAPVANQYLSGKFDPQGRFKLSVLLPTQEEWRNGDRQMRCGLQVPLPSGAVYPVIGAVSTQDQSDVHEAGICLGISGKSVYDPVSCDKPHSFEIIGVVDLGAQFHEGFPEQKKQDEALLNACTAMAKQYAPGQDIGKKGLTIAWDNRSQESWNAGSFRVNCKLGAPLPDGSGLAPVTGSVRGEVTVGKEPAPAVTSTPWPGTPATPVQPPAAVPHPSERPPAHPPHGPAPSSEAAGSGSGG